MSAQAGTLARRGTVHVPVWPFAALLAAAAVVAIVMSIPTSGTSGVQITRVGDAARFANSSAEVREHGDATTFASNPGMWTQAQAQAYVDSLVTSGTGLDDPVVGVAPEGTFISVEHPRFRPKVGGYRPIEVNGEICGQCR